MHIKQITLTDFKSYKNTTINLHSQHNVIGKFEEEIPPHYLPKIKSTKTEYKRYPPKHRYSSLFTKIIYSTFVSVYSGS